MTNILLCTLGASWAVAPEIYGFTSPGKLPLYRHHPNKPELDKLLAEYDLEEVDEIWVCTTQGEATQKSLASLVQWADLLPKPPILRIWMAEATNELTTQHECRHIRELIVRAVLAAHEYAQGGQVTLSLAGGRKTMSADMQWAATVFGCSALLHVIGAEFKQMPESLKNAAPELFTKPLIADNCAAIMPLITGQTQRSDLLDIRMDDCEAVTAQAFPLPLPETGQSVVWPAPDKWLEQELKNREKTGSRLLGNYFFDLSRHEKHENWRSLYRLSPRLINHLRQTPLGPEHKNWLERLPKADLHRHLGGCLNLEDQRQVGLSVWQALSKQEKAKALAAVKTLLDESDRHWDWNWIDSIKNCDNKAHLSAALLVEASDAQLHNNLWQATEPRVALKHGERGFSAYERPGDLSGSTLLSSPAAIPSYAECIVRQCVVERLAYVELRGSPQKYGDGLVFLESFYQALQQALASLPARLKPEFRFIIIADRRKNEQLQQTIALAVQAKRRWPDFIVGLDLAGDESELLPDNIGEVFLPAFEVCLPITIHAGEGEEAGAIWKAAYLLHADRIGHGLTLNDHPELAERFRNRDICLELCPTSNIEVVGFRVPGNPATEQFSEYPLMSLWDKGLPLTVCTDNPGISRTTLTGEYLMAAAMSDGKLTLWDALAMIKQGFVHAFLPGGEKERLLKRFDADIYRYLSETFDFNS
ncbi:CRISPR-associated ring nuclease [Methylomarinum sp. Ch1-1]|uniref:adenosine deaminase n=1 Tax=Methylomarinum roseum TaxID=3067653 RepID=A0AAU7NQ21_9GAMM|nr:CRISPR-associated ring nuclease [Methylomarinum sp. Ch1-1]MDP4521009.1 CRISPR-associated ring nuclease [Methylomarinum sp. Ch1-1]